MLNINRHIKFLVGRRVAKALIDIFISLLVLIVFFLVVFFARHFGYI